MGKELATRLLARPDREAELAGCRCPGCGGGLVVESRRRDATLAVVLVEEATLRCANCGFAAAVCCRESSGAFGRDRQVVIDGVKVRERHTPRPTAEASGLDEAGDIVW